MSEEKTTIRKKKKKKKLNLIRLTIVLTIVFSLIGIGSATGLVLYSIKDMPAWNPAALEPHLPTYIYDKDHKLVTKIYLENRDPLEFDDIPDVVKNAFLSIEDVRFYRHKGLDFRRIAGAFVADIKEGKAVQGASTITQQLVKRAFLSPEKTLKRKIQEAILALQLERRYTKDEIFEMYLNQIYFGEGAYGIKAAAEVYFGKKLPEQELTIEEAALLAGLPKAPSAYSPYKNLEAATNRRNIVLAAMAKNGYINKSEAELLKSKPVVLNNSNSNSTAYNFPYFVDYVTDLLVEKYGEDKVYKGGLKVYTTLDPKIQRYAEEAVANSKNFPKSKNDEKGIIQPQTAVVVIDHNTGHIKAIIGGRNHEQKRGFNRAIDAVRQPGSAFKPIVAYAPALEKGKAPASVVKDEPLKIGSHEFKNYDGQYHGIVTYRRAVMKSYNIPAVSVMQETGISYGIDFARKLGISTLILKKDNARMNDENLSVALGGLTQGVKPVELAAAYGAFANEGVYIEPIAITEVRDYYDNLLDRFTPKKKIAMKKTTAYLMTDMLRSVVTSGTGTRASLGSRPVAGKTGTTSDYKDAWFAGYTPELVCVVWMGHDDPKKMPGVTGGSYPAKIWRQIMSNSLKNVPVKQFVRPAGIVTATVCSKSGLLPSESCPQEELVTDLFAKSTVPNKICEMHVLVDVCAESNLLPTENCPNVVKKGFVKGSEPTQQCNIHTEQNKPKGIPVCIDPTSGIMYRANIPGPNEEGGCPSHNVHYIEFPEGEEPEVFCTNPEHQIRPKNVPTDDEGDEDKDDSNNNENNPN